MKHLLKDPQREKPGPPPTPEHRPPSPSSRPTAAWGQPGAQRSGQQRLQTQDWEVAQIVAQLVSEDVDKDVLIPHPQRSAEPTHAFHTLLARSKPF